MASQHQGESSTPDTVELKGYVYDHEGVDENNQPRLWRLASVNKESKKVEIYINTEGDTEFREYRFEFPFSDSAVPTGSIEGTAVSTRAKIDGKHTITEEEWIESVTSKSSIKVQTDDVVQEVSARLKRVYPLLDAGHM